MTRDLDDVLDDVKNKLLCYCVLCDYGSQELGLDDTGSTRAELQVRVVAAPAGFLGGLRVCFQGSLQDLCEMDLFQEPRVVPNPPINAQLLKGKTGKWKVGAFVWGSSDSVRDWPAKLDKRRERWVR